ncbi:MAG: FAD-dependent oxidoreductase [Pelagimonas sp.]|uniref:FAD-dependent oxidoreductase n=1 Tax=Pelagimonas sp. TaxID=2073170 RepID=UPI003D6BC035
MANSKPHTGPINERTLVQFQDDLPESADVVIIGGGVVGVFAALYLTRLGQKVIVCEKGRVAGEQSSRNWGWNASRAETRLNSR